MKRHLLNIYRCIVGSEAGFFGEGNEQWYYFLSFVINTMLILWLKSEIAIAFILLMVIHYVMVCIYGYNCISDYGPAYSYLYFGIHLVLLVIAFIVNVIWALITMSITIIAFVLAPDCCGTNIFLRRKPYTKWTLVLNGVMFAIFVTITFMLPIELWVKFLIVIGMMIIHPVIDYFEGECIIISDVTLEALDNII